MASVPAYDSAAKPAPRPRTAHLAPARDQDVIGLVQQLSPGFPLTNLEKVLYPDDGLRKAELLAYYAAIAGWMLPHVAKRPLVLLRCPEGGRKGCFFQKHVTESVPRAVGRVTIAEARREGVYGFVKDISGLLALAQLSTLELHTWACHVGQIEKPDLFTFDIDPDLDLPFAQVVEAALGLRAQLARLGLQSFVKTTGGKGLHVVAPVKPKHGWPEHKAFALAVVTTMMKAEPKLYVTSPRKEARKGKIFLDYLRNARGASAVAPYSPRAREGALIATPLSWDELAQGARPEQFDLRSVIRRLQQNQGDPWPDFFQVSQSLPRLAGRRQLARR